MKPKKRVKALIITLCTVVVLAGAGFGGWYFLQNREQEPVNVYSFEYLGMTEYWGDSQESYGPVTTDRIQTVFVSDTQTVTEVLVQAGDTVKKGDVLLRFDTTLTDIALERERLELEKQKLKLSEAQEELRRINAMKPMVVPQYTPVETQPNLGSALDGEYQLSQDKSYDGSSKEHALILWIHDQKNVDDAVFEAARAWAEACQEANAATAPTEAPTPAPTEAPTEPSVDETTEPSTEESTEPSTEATTEPSTEATTEPSTDATTEPSTDATTEPSTDATTEPSTDATTEPSTDATTEPSTDATTEPSTDATTEPSTDATTEPSTDATTPPTQTQPDLNVDKFYMVMKITDGNMSLGDTLVFQGMEVSKAGQSFTFRLFDASSVPDHIRPTVSSPEPELPQIDMGSGYTSAQIAEMRAQQEKAIRDQQFQVKMAESNYQIKCKEVQSPDVLAAIDGTVVSLLSEEDAKADHQPILKLSGGGGFYIQGSVSELQKDKLLPGQAVTVNDWNTGMTYEGTVESVGDFPTGENSWNGMNNPNVSYYPFTVFVDETADLQEGSYVNMVYSAGDAQQGIYLENPFLRTEQGGSFVYVADANGKLEKRPVTTGKSLWGSYTQILDGLSAEDLIAFPYGKNLKPGAPTRLSDISELYS